MIRCFGAVAALSVALVPTSSLAQAVATGDWIGSLQTPTGPVTVAIHVRGTPGGATATIDAIEYGTRGSPLSNVVATDGRLAFDNPGARARFAGSWDAAAKAWKGNWTDAAGKAWPLALTAGLPPPVPRIAGLDGDWRGTLNTGVSGLLRLVLHVRTGPEGTLATLDSPDQGIAGLPAVVSANGRGIGINIVVIGARYEAELAADGQRMQGEFNQGATLLPLAFTREGDGPSTPSAASSAALARPASWRLPSDGKIRAVLTRRIDVERRGVGIVVGVISPAGRRIVAYGTTDLDHGRRVDADTLFEIGSITKTFNALLLQDMALRGEVSLDDPIAKYLPAPALADRSGKPITLRQLATHRSGLPANLSDGTEKTPDAVFSSATEPKLLAWLANYRAPASPAPEWSYSNLATGMLGIALSRRAGKDYAALLRERVTGPLDMPATIFGVPAAQPRLATGHDAYLRPIGPFEIGAAEAAAGAIRSSANDMLNYLGAYLGYAPSPLKPAMDAMFRDDYGPALAGMRQALGWMSFAGPKGTIFTHSGGTLGQRAFAAFNPKTREAVVVLANAESVSGADDIGMWIIAGAPVRELPPAPPPPGRMLASAEVSLGAAQAQAYLGSYRLTSHISVAVSYEGEHLQMRTTLGDRTTPAIPLAAHGSHAFTVAQDTAISFRMDESGRATGFVLRGPTGDLYASRTAPN